MQIPTSHPEHDLADQAQEAAVLIPCSSCQMLTPHQVEQVVETLGDAQELVAARCEVCAGVYLVVL